MRLLVAMHDPWMAQCLAIALGDAVAGVVTYGGPAEAARFGALGVPVRLVPPADEATTLGLLDDPAVAAFVADEPSRLLCFKPSRRLELQARELGAELALTSAAVAQPLENKLALSLLAAEAGITTAPEDHDEVALPAQAKVTVRDDLTRADLCALVATDGPVVVQSPRGFMGKRTWRVERDEDWEPIRARLPGRPLKVSRYLEGRPGTLNAVVDAAGTVLCTAPIVQVTGDARLTPYRLGSCGNDFTWRPAPHPGSGPYELVRRLGPILARQGYRGHFGVDFVVEDRGERPPRTWLIEINPRLTASMALYSAWRPILARAHVAVLDGSDLRSTGELPPLEGGQVLLHNLGDEPGAPLDPAEVGLAIGDASLPDDACVWPQVTLEVTPGGTRGRIVKKGAVVDARGALLLRLPSS